MNLKRFSLCCLTGFIFVFIYEYIIHGVALVAIYDQTPQLWRSPETMVDYMPFMIVMQFLTTALLCFIYTRHHEEKGIGEGVRFGAMIGLLLGILQASSFAWMPISLTLAGLWLVTTFVEAIGLSILFSLIYKK